MSSIFGILDLDSSDRVFVNTVGQAAVYEAVNELTDRWNTEVALMLEVFLEEETENFKERYYLPAGGYMERMGQLTTSGAVQTTGSYDVAFPLENFGAQIAGDDISLAYLSLQDLDRHLQSVFTRDANTMRFEILKALFNDNQDTFVDPLHGSLSIEPLANGDAVVYPPVIGASAEATDDHYLESGYLSSAISDTNNPLVTMKDEIEEHFDVSAAGSDILIFIANAEKSGIEGLTDYDALIDHKIKPGQDTDIVIGLPSRLPGKVIGRSNGVWVVEWRHLPATYMLGIDPTVSSPLKLRVDPADTGLARGLTLVATNDKYPLASSHWRRRFGFGVANRLNGVAMEVASGGSYTIPTAYQ